MRSETKTRNSQGISASQHTARYRQASWKGRKADGGNGDKSISGTGALQGQAGSQACALGICRLSIQIALQKQGTLTLRAVLESTQDSCNQETKPRRERKEKGKREKKTPKSDKHRLFQAALPRTCHSHENMEITGVRHRCADKQQLPRSTGGPWEHMDLLFLALRFSEDL